MQLADVELRLFTGLLSNDRPPLMVDAEHQFLGTRPRVPEDAPQNQGHVRHEVDGIVPHHDKPEAGLLVVLLREDPTSRIRDRIEDRRALPCPTSTEPCRRLCRPGGGPDQRRRRRAIRR